MAVFQRILELLIAADFDKTEPEVIIPAPPTNYEIKALTEDNLKEVLLLNLRCFKRGENYTKYTFRYLLTAPNILSYKLITAEKQMVGFVFISVNNEIGHITTIGIAPEHRRRGLGEKLLDHIENTLRKKDVSSIYLEVRVSNSPAQKMYLKYGYEIIQKVTRYYHNGEDAYLMSKNL